MAIQEPIQITGDQYTIGSTDSTGDVERYILPARYEVVRAIPGTTPYSRVLRLRERYSIHSGGKLSDEFSNDTIDSSPNSYVLAVTSAARTHGTIGTLRVVFPSEISEAETLQFVYATDTTGNRLNNTELVAKITDDPDADINTIGELGRFVLDPDLPIHEMRRTLALLLNRVVHEGRARNIKHIIGMMHPDVARFVGLGGFYAIREVKGLQLDPRSETLRTALTNSPYYFFRKDDLLELLNQSNGTDEATQNKLALVFSNDMAREALIKTLNARPRLYHMRLDDIEQVVDKLLREV